MEGTKPADHPDSNTVETRQGTGPGATVSVLFVSMGLAALVGLALVAYWLWLK